ncbi:hypothetical protein ABVF61_00595 [Roseibium sp. HPY-6]|uniref:hypothetical protein n=1 Tax=Roseibium sp. HPY-6 TaxID=3229852 RepID=UPI0033903470
MRAHVFQHEREKSREDILTIENVDRALDILAALIDGPRPNLLPAYIRLEQIRDDLLANDDAMSRVRARNQAKKRR